MQRSLATLFDLIAEHTHPADRPVTTPLGKGQLWQVFTGRVGVVLDASPDRVRFFEPKEVKAVNPPLPLAAQTGAARRLGCEPIPAHAG